MLAECESTESEPALSVLWQRVVRLEAELATLRQTLLASGAAAESPRPPTARSERPAAATDTWQVTMLGNFRVQREGAELPMCPSRRGRSILKFLLASHGFGAQRAVLVDTFWPSAEPERGAHNLQMAVHAMRQSLIGWGPGGSDEVILFCQDCYLLNPQLVIKQDVERFRQAYDNGQHAVARGDQDAARRAFEQARALYTGSYLSDSPYEDWAEQHRAGLEDMQLGVLAHLSRIYAQAREWDQASVCCRALLAVDAYREDAYRQLMRCYAAGGRRTEVRRVFQLCQDRLHRELQVEPAPETRQLYHELLNAPAARSV